MIGLVALGAVDFTKGCYLGQEVVARAEHRGQVKRALARLRFAAGAPQPGTGLEDAEGREVGVVLQTASRACLAVLRDGSPTTLHGDGVAFELD